LAQFSKWDETLKKGGVKSVQELYKKIFDEIRKNPDRVGQKPKLTKAQKKEKNAAIKYTDKERNVVETAKGKYLRSRKITRAQKKKNVEKKLQIATAAQAKKKKNT